MSTVPRGLPALRDPPDPKVFQVQQAQPVRLDPQVLKESKAQQVPRARRGMPGRPVPLVKRVRLVLKAWRAKRVLPVLKDLRAKREKRAPPALSAKRVRKGTRETQAKPE